MRTEERIFGEALSRGTPAERSAYLDVACGRDAGLRQAVESLLGAHDAAGGFLAGAPVGLPTLGAELGCDRRLPGTAQPGESDQLCESEQRGEEVGTYRLLERLGEGGMGVVYVAEQQSPMRRRVALKIIKPGMDTRQVIARFEAERQALALMDHHNIALVLDGGSTKAGRPYFVMELVQGAPLVSYCDECRLDVEARLGLFLQVCAAVQHAHQKGVIHRDLKPSNVLVTLADGRPLVKVIDFGIAKAVGQALTERTLVTHCAQLLGTPSYMSPEQAGADPCDVDTRSDVYSLGALLYELLTGVAPIGGAEDLGPDEIRRMIREDDAPSPSVRVRALASHVAADAAARRGAATDRLVRLLRGDLDCIVLKAMEKDRGRRYETVGALAEDLRRHLAYEPVVARRPGRLYCLRRTLQRHRVGLVASSLVVFALIAGLAFMAVGLRRADRERNAALAARHEALRQKTEAQESERRAMAAAKRATAASDFLQDVIGSLDPWDPKPGREAGTKPPVAGPPLRQILDVATIRLNEGALSGYREEEASVRLALSRGYQGLGLFPEAEPHLRRALALQRELHGGRDHPEVARRMAALAVHLAARASNPDSRKMQPEAEQLATDAIAMQRRLRLTAELPDTLLALALAKRAKGDFVSAEALGREALRMRNEEPAGPTSTQGLARALLDTSVSIGRRGNDLEEAIAMLLQAMDIHARTLPPEHPLVGVTATQLAGLLDRVGRLEEAARHYRTALASRRTYMHEDHNDVCKAIARLHSALLAQGGYQECDSLLREHEARLRPFEPGVARRVALYGMYCRLYQAWGRAEQAAHWKDMLRQAFDQQIAAASREVQAADADVRPIIDRARLYVRAARFADALADCREVLRRDPGRTEVWFLQACLLAHLNSSEAYAPVAREVLARFGARRLPNVLDYAVHSCLLMPGHGIDADILCKLADEVRAIRANEQRQLPWAHLIKGMAEYRAGHFSEAIDWLRDVRRSEFMQHRAAAAFFRALAHQRLHQTAEAAAALFEGQRMADRLPAAGLADLRDGGDGGVENWLLCQIARREAEALISPPP
jgi:serine/threonine protein kinase